MRASYACATLIAAACAAAPRPALAQSATQAATIQQQIDQLRKEFGDRLAALESQLSTLQGAQSAPAPAPAPEPAAAQAVGQGGALANSKVFNPDMAVIGNFLGAAGSNSTNPSPALEMHESEASFQAVVDPYARADFFMAFGEEGVELEEGYLTLTELPGKLLTRVGKMRAAFGKVNSQHNHVLPWTDRPLVTQNLVGGEEGISDAGISVARLIPAGSVFLEATGQVFRGDSGDLFTSSEPSDLSYVAHLRGYHDITESTNVDLGASYAYGHNAAGVRAGVDLGRFTTSLFGTDVTLRWRPLTRAIYHQFVGRGEMVWSDRRQFQGPVNSFGYYASGDYQFARRWWVGGRYDRSGRADQADTIDRGTSALLTYWPSEFSQVRGQYRYINYADSPAANEFLFQFQFSIGAHGAHPF